MSQTHGQTDHSDELHDSRDGGAERNWVTCRSYPHGTFLRVPHSVLNEFWLWSCGIIQITPPQNLREERSQVLSTDYLLEPVFVRFTVREGGRPTKTEKTANQACSSELDHIGVELLHQIPWICSDPHALKTQNEVATAELLPTGPESASGWSLEPATRTVQALKGGNVLL